MSNWASISGSPVFEDMKSARAAAKKLEFAEWKWAENPGDGKRFTVFRCNMHVECCRLVRAAQICPGMFELQMKGEHSETLNSKRRKNSALTFDQEREARQLVNAGSKPGAMRAVMTKDECLKLEAAGEDVLEHKRPEGGLEGERPAVSRVRVSSNTHVSYMYRNMYHHSSCRHFPGGS